MHGYEQRQPTITTSRRRRSPTRSARVNGASKSPPDELQFYPIEVDFNALPDEAERRFFESLPTSFYLPPATVDRLRAVAARMLRRSENYRKLLRDLNGPATR